MRINTSRGNHLGIAFKDALGKCQVSYFIGVDRRVEGKCFREHFIGCFGEINCYDFAGQQFSLVLWFEPKTGGDT